MYITRRKKEIFFKLSLVVKKMLLFFSNEPGDLYFLLHTFGVKIILFKLKKKKNCVEGKKI